MCGIAGALDLTGRRMFPIDRAVAMTRAIAHRGPDAEGIHREPGVFLGARSGALLSRRVSPRQLRIVFIVVALFFAFQMFLKAATWPT